MTAIVTGSNTGIGKETAQDFYLRGARVIMACRDTVKAQAAKMQIEDSESADSSKGSLVVEKLDLSSFQSIREFVRNVLVREARINILVNNAGVFCVPDGRTEEGFEMHMGTNHFGHALLTLLLLPRLVQCAPSRIVTVSSELHRVANVDFTEANNDDTEYHRIIKYAKSKCANVLFSKVLAKKFKEYNIKNVTTYSLHPGVINTDIWSNFNTSVWFGPVWMFQNILYWFGKTSRCGAQTTIYCALDDACAEQSGLYYSECGISTESLFCRDDENAIKLWDLTIKLLKLGDYNPFGVLDPSDSLLTQRELKEIFVL